MDIDGPKLIRRLIVLGVPGVSLGFFYLLLRTFDFQFEAVGPMWSAIVVIVFLLTVGGVTLYALRMWAPERTRIPTPTPTEPTSPESNPGGRAVTTGDDVKDSVIVTGNENTIVIEAPPSGPERVAPPDGVPVGPLVDIHRLPSSGPLLIGRAKQLGRLTTAWNNEKTNVISLVAFGGVGKSALVNHWLASMAEKGYRGARRVYGWSAYSQGSKERVTSADLFIEQALRFFGPPGTRRRPSRRGPPPPNRRPNPHPTNRLPPPRWGTGRAGGTRNDE